jgi:hypothetical protein
MVYVVAGLFLLACAALSRLSPAGTGVPDGDLGGETPPGLTVDADGDGLLDGNDNCPLTANGDQGDADANGLGDACDSPFASGFAFVGDDGVTQLIADERLRPTQIVTPTTHITLAWSDDASRLEMTVQNDQVRDTFTLLMDFGDEALLAALDAGEEVTGQDLTPLREWIGQNPGQVLAVTRGDVPPPSLLPTPSSSLPAGKGLSAVNPMVSLQMDIEDYLYVLATTMFITENTMNTFSESHPELTPAAATARNALSDVWIAANVLYVEQERACHPCSAACQIPCSLDTGACFTDPAQFGNPKDPGPCYEITERACTDRGGVSFPEDVCPSACWFTNPEFANLPASERCVMTDLFTCFDMPNRANQQQRGGEGLNVTTLFCRYRTCGDPVCTP